jgi:hypothetical protein
MKRRLCASDTVAKERLTEGSGDLKAGRVYGCLASAVEMLTPLHNRAL